MFIRMRRRKDLSHHGMKGTYDMLTLHQVQSKDRLSFIAFRRYHSIRQFEIITSITVVDHAGRIPRYTVVYERRSTRYSVRLMVSVEVDEGHTRPSICSIYKSANWNEREVWDIYGIGFTNHPDLRRLLTDYGFEGHPIRKEFPLSGYEEVRYDEGAKRVISEEIERAQQMRSIGKQEV